MAQEEDRLRFALDEIEAVSPTPHEDELLVDKVKRLQDVDSLRDSAGRAFQALSSDDTEETSSAIDLLGEAQSALASSGDSQLVNLGTQIHNLLEQVGTFHPTSADIWPGSHLTPANSMLYFSVRHS